MQSSTGISKEADQPGIEPGRGDKCGMQITGMRDTGGELGSKSGDHVILPGPPRHKTIFPGGENPVPFRPSLRFEFSCNEASRVSP